MVKPQFEPKSQNPSGRKHLRFRNRPLHNVILQLKECGPYLRIANISLGGIGILADPQDEYDDEFEALLTINKERFNIRLIKIFQDEIVIGCQFQEANPQLQESIQKYFQTELLALNLNRVETLPTAKNGQVKTIFFHGKNNCELLINEKNGQIQYLNVIVLGNCIEVDPKQRLLVGQRIDDENIPKRHGLFVFKTLEHPQEHIFNVATRFIDSIEILPVEFRRNLIKIIDDTKLRQGVEDEN